MEEKKSNNKLLLEVKNEIRDITNDVFIIRNELKCIKDLIQVKKNYTPVRVGFGSGLNGIPKQLEINCLYWGLISPLLSISF